MEKKEYPFKGITVNGFVMLLVLLVLLLVTLYFTGDNLISKDGGPECIIGVLICAILVICFKGFVLRLLFAAAGKNEKHAYDYSCYTNRFIF